MIFNGLVEEEYYKIEIEMNGDEKNQSSIFIYHLISISIFNNRSSIPTALEISEMFAPVFSHNAEIELIDETL